MSASITSSAAKAPKLRRIALLGSRAVGKSSMIIQYVENVFVDSYFPTIERTFTKSLTFHGQPYDVELIDTAGQDERARLLDEHTEVCRYGPNGMMVPTSYGEQNQVRELESLQKIVERTAGNLIDIPSTLHLERLQQQEAQNRSNEYSSALSTVKLPQQTIRKLCSMTSVKASSADLPALHDVLETGKEGSATSSRNSIKAPSVREVLAEKTVDSKTVGWMASAMGELHQATESMDVEDVGDLIVTLSPPVRR
ncbi:GTP-binding protein [Mortierella alpina]|nr:GTP-binding protein [Mortierella alpina]